MVGVCVMVGVGVVGVGVGRGVSVDVDVDVGGAFWVAAVAAAVRAARICSNSGPICKIAIRKAPSAIHK